MMTGTSTVTVGPFVLCDGSREDVVDTIWEAPRPTRAFALHVGALNMRHDRDFVDAINRSEVTYADGSAVVHLARLNGAHRIMRAPTTDIAWDLLRLAATRLGRDVRVAVIGGAAGVADRAAATLMLQAPCDVGFATHGYHDDYHAVIAEAMGTRPDVVLVGMGMPLEARWCLRYATADCDAIFLTCGGWLGFLDGDEHRAPVWMQRASLEWVDRLAQDPRRLLPRYAHGAVSTAAIAVTSVVSHTRR